MLALSPLATAGIVVCMILATYLPQLLEQERSLRCTACGVRVGKKHHADCHYKDRL